MRKAVVVALLTTGFGAAALAGTAQAATGHHPVPGKGRAVVTHHGKGKAHHKRLVKHVTKKVAKKG